jgi:hypothetical protein
MSTIEAFHHSAGVDEDGSSQESSLGTSTNVSSTGSPAPSPEKSLHIPQPSSANDVSLPELFGENVAAKVWRVAISWLKGKVSWPTRKGYKLLRC